MIVGRRFRGDLLFEYLMKAGPLKYAHPHSLLPIPSSNGDSYSGIVVVKVVIIILLMLIELPIIYRTSSGYKAPGPPLFREIGTPDSGR